jgi:hypothetical protein
MTADPNTGKACPHCRAANEATATICGQCLRSLLDFPPADPPAVEETARTRNPQRQQSLFRRIKRWWNRRSRRAE